MNDTNPSPENGYGQIPSLSWMASNPDVSLHISQTSALDLYRDDLKLDGMNTSDLAVVEVILTDEDEDEDPRIVPIRQALALGWQVSKGKSVARRLADCSRPRRVCLAFSRQRPGFVHSPWRLVQPSMNPRPHYCL